MSDRSAFLSAALAAVSSFACAAQPAADAPPPGAHAAPVVDRSGRYPGPRTGVAPPRVEASRVYIDPNTREIIDRPADADPIVSPKSNNQIDYTIRASEEGYLYIDTSDHVEVSRATLGPDGGIEYSCGLDHDHSEDAR